MRLLRYGASGQERPAMVDDQGRRAGLLPAWIDRLWSLDPAGVPEVGGAPPIGPCVGAVGKIIGMGPRRRIRDGGPDGAAGLFEALQRDYRPQ